jgi:hypothetical protein
MQLKEMQLDASVAVKQRGDAATAHAPCAAWPDSKLSTAAVRPQGRRDAERRCFPIHPSPISHLSATTLNMAARGGTYNMSRCSTTAGMASTKPRHVTVGGRIAHKHSSCRRSTHAAAPSDAMDTARQRAGRGRHPPDTPIAASSQRFDQGGSASRLQFSAAREGTGVGDRLPLPTLRSTEFWKQPAGRRASQHGFTPIYFNQEL